MTHVLLRSACVTGVAAASMLLSGCVVAPIHPGVRAPAAVVYVAPTYAMPGPGFVWVHHQRFGWGWRHAHHGWHHGWR